MKNSGLMAFLIGALALLMGCRSNLYFQDRAVNKAREFVLENVRDLTPEQVYYIKFNDPVLLHAPILGQRGYSATMEHLNSETEQICVYFQVPGVEKGILVYGVSDQRMYNWKPIRLIRKNFVSQQYFIEPAIGAARNYAQNSLYPQLTARDFNHIRFMPPALLETNLVFNFNPGNKLDPKAETALRQAAAKGQQLSLVWHLPESGKYAVFTGYSQAKREIKGWVLNIADIYSETDLTAAAMAVFKCPGTVVQEAPKGVKVIDLPQLNAAPVVKFNTATPRPKNIVNKEKSVKSPLSPKKADISQVAPIEVAKKAAPVKVPTAKKVTAEPQKSPVHAVEKKAAKKSETSFDADDLTRSYEEQTQNAAPQAQKDK